MGNGIPIVSAVGATDLASSIGNASAMGVAIGAAPPVVATVVVIAATIAFLAWLLDD